MYPGVSWEGGVGRLLITVRVAEPAGFREQNMKSEWTVGKLSPGQALSPIHNNVCLLETVSSDSAVSG